MLNEQISDSSVDLKSIKMPDDLKSKLKVKRGKNYPELVKMGIVANYAWKIFTFYKWLSIAIIFVNIEKGLGIEVCRHKDIDCIENVVNMAKIIKCQGYVINRERIYMDFHIYFLA
uniref:Uncharacterized protein n=1 Tax=Meloidogyne enterolobii TaxID=390850 RepID=A0A6V7VI57_MELEN|nr:unnamed protein product [Meloidogyne enterolobii]